MVSCQTNQRIYIFKMLGADLKIISLNIEQDKHLARVIPFLQERRPDVVLLQEVLLENMPILEKELGMKSSFLVMKILVDNEGRHPCGMATLSALPMVKSQNTYYYEVGETPPSAPRGNPLKTARGILVTEVLKDKKAYRLINTHFTWTPDGQDTPQQHAHLQNLFKLLSDFPEFILCGDFNAPRGRVIFDEIASRYKDNIPPLITTTIDKNLHRADDLQLVVDGLFSTPMYHVQSVELFDGLSDHYAISAHAFLDCTPRHIWTRVEKSTKKSGDRGES